MPLFQQPELGARRTGIRRKAFRKRRSRRARRSRRGNNGRPSDVMIYKGIGMPDQFFTKMKYTEVIQLTAGLGTEYQVYQFRGNSLYDPNFTGTGAQPPYFDQICGANALYTQFLVSASKIKLRVSAIGDTFAIGNADVAVTPSQTAYASTLWTDVDDQLSSKSTRSAAVVRYDNRGPKYVKNYAMTSKVFDTKDIQDQLSIFAGTSSANPTAPWYWIIGAQGMDRTSTTMNLNILVTLTYYVRFFNLTDQDQS